MKASMFYGKRLPDHRLVTRLPPVESDNSCLRDSGDDDKEEGIIPNPEYEEIRREDTDDRSCNDEAEDALPTTSESAARLRSSASTSQRQRVVWKTVKQQKI